MSIRRSTPTYAIAFMLALGFALSSCGTSQTVSSLDTPIGDGSRSRPIGTVTAADLSAQFIDDPCAALAEYHDRWWRVTGVVEPKDRWGRWPLTALPLSGGVHPSNGQACRGTVLFPNEFAEEAVLVELRSLVGDPPQEEADLVCRIRLSGFGTMDYSPQIWARDCQAPED